MEEIESIALSISTINEAIAKVNENNNTIELYYTALNTDNEIGMTSLSFVKIIVALETEFEIEFEDTDFDVEKFKCINDFISYVQKKVVS